MPRPPRVDFVDGIHHVMNRGTAHADVFFSDNDRIEFGQRLLHAYEMFGVIVLAYCLMDNHYHLVLRSPQGRLSEAMQSIGSIYTRHVNDRLGRDGPLFRGRFHSRLIEDDRDLQAVVRYVHRNALDLPGVVAPDQYRWSSHRTYLGHRQVPVWLSTTEVMAHWHGDRAAFDRFVAADLSTSSLGVDPDGLRAMVAACDLVVAECLADVDQRTASLARTIALAWAIEGGASIELLMDVFEVQTPNAMRVAMSRARRRLSSSPNLVEIRRRAEAIVAGRLALHPGSDPGCNQRAARAAS